MGDSADVKKYKPMENVLNKINQKYISLSENDKKRNAVILETVTEDIIKRMKDADTLFKTMYERKFYGGSYYDGLKVSKPEEYDLDLVLNLPAIIEPIVEGSNKHGFVHVRIQEYLKMESRPEACRYPKKQMENVPRTPPGNRFRNSDINRPKPWNYKRTNCFSKLHRIMDDNKYVCTNKVLQWIESILTAAFKLFPREGNRIVFDMKLGNRTTRLYLKLVKQHPAFTLTITDSSGSIYLDVDLVTCFQFNEKHWPKGKYRRNPVSGKRNFLVVPKKPHDSNNLNNLFRYWRLSFQEQERVLLKGDQYKAVKPCIKLIKYLRDKHNHKIASYFIKTIFLWEVEKQSKDYWAQPLSIVFMQMLKTYESHLRLKKIPYYWNSQFNLIEYLKDITTLNIANTIKRMIEEIERKIQEPFIVATYFVSDIEVAVLKGEVDLGKKIVKKLENLHL